MKRPKRKIKNWRKSQTHTYKLYRFKTCVFKSYGCESRGSYQFGFPIPHGKTKGVFVLGIRITQHCEGPWNDFNVSKVFKIEKKLRKY